ncbi:MAG: rhomboid family intramembrane serine protease [Planctomycetota bacterium]
MSFDSRDYARPGDARDSGRFGGGFSGGGGFGGPGGRLNRHSVTTWILVGLLGFFIVSNVFGGSSRAGVLNPARWGVFQLELATSGFQVWRFFTYQLFHADFFHLLFNGIGIYFFGPLLESWWGRWRFLAFYLLCGACGSLGYVALGAIPGLLPGGNQGVLLGASGAVFGILAAAATLFPHQRVQLLFPPIPMSMRTMALVFLGIAALSVLAGSRNAGGEAAHLGGALLGFVLVKKPGLLAWVPGATSSPGSFGEAGGFVVKDASPLKRVKQKVADARKQREADTDAKLDAEVDRLLAKVRRDGMHSLSAKERKTLQQATDRENKRAS